MEDKRNINKVLESQGDVHEKVANQSNLKLPSVSPSRSPRPARIQIDIQIPYDLHFGHSTYARKARERTFPLEPVSCPTKIGVIGNHQNSHPTITYLTATWPDIQFAMCLRSRFQASSCTSHWIVIQQIFRYLKYTLEFEISYSASSSLELFGFFVVDFAGCGTCHFLELLSFVGLLEKNLQLPNPPQRLIM
jgi:hypothetical protein